MKIRCHFSLWFLHAGTYSLFAVVLLCFGVPQTGAAGSEQLTLISNGQSDYRIVVADDADPAKINEASLLLQDILSRATGMELPILTESQAATDPDHPALYLGRTRAAREAGIDVDAVIGWSCQIQAIGGNIFLIGEDVERKDPAVPAGVSTDSETGRRVRPEPIDFASGPSGTYKAVTSFLELFAGVRFVLPGPDGIHVPQLDTLSIPANFDWSWSPLFDFVIGRSVRVRPGRAHGGYTADRIFDPYSIANNFLTRSNQDTAIFKSYGAHSYPEFVPAEVYFDSNPEYFAMRGNGERVPTSRNLLCISNPDVQRLLVEGVERDFEKGYQMVMLGQSDGYLPCQCDDCKAIHPDIGEQLWIVNRGVAEELNRRHPDKQVVLLSYVFASKPPLTFDSFPDNVVIMNNRYSPDYFAAWRHISTPKIIFNPSWLGLARRVAPRYAVDQIRLFLENDVIGIYLCGGLDCGSGSGWGLNGPAYYAFGKAMGDPAADADVLEREFVEAAYGEVAGPMLSFFRTMHRRWEVVARFDRMEVGVDRRYRGYPFDMNSSDMYGHFFSPEVLLTMQSALDRALERATDPLVRLRIELVEAEFRYVSSVATVHHLFRAYRLRPSWELLAALESAVMEHRDTVDWLSPNGRPWSANALRAPFNGVTLNVSSADPFGWDFAAIRKSGELPIVRLEHRTRGGDGLPPYTFESDHFSGPSDAAETHGDYQYEGGPAAPIDM